MARPNCGCIAFLLVSVLAATARADDPPATPAPAPADAPGPAAAPVGAPTPPPVAAARRFTGTETSYYMSGTVADSPVLMVGLTLPSGVSLAVGGAVSYNKDGLAPPAVTDKFAFTGVLYGAYYFYNKFPVGIALETSLVADLAPSPAFQDFTIQPGMVVYYAPFPAPIVIGSALDLKIDILKNKGTTVNTLTPGLRIIYLF